MKTLKENIITLFFIEHLKVKEIAEKVNTSSAYITKIIKQDTRYIQEKNTEKLSQKIREKLLKITLLRTKEKSKKLMIITLSCNLNMNRQLENYQNQNIYQMKIIENGIIVPINTTLQEKGTNLMRNLVDLLMYLNI